MNGYVLVVMKNYVCQNIKYGLVILYIVVRSIMGFIINNNSFIHW